MYRKTIVVSLMAVFFLASAFAFGGDKAKGMIVARTGETLIVKSGQTTTTVVLTRRFGDPPMRTAEMGYSHAHRMQ
jgi:hypothetical protein